MKILHSADLHLGAPFAGFSAEERAELTAYQKKLPDMLASLCKERGCEMVLLAGDVFDAEPGGEWFTLLCQAVEDMAVPVVITPGNHDPYTVTGGWNTYGLPGNAVLFTEAQVQQKEICGIHVYGGAFLSMDSPSLLKDFHADGGIGVFHGDATQTKSDYNPVTAKQIEACGLDYLALGHIHLHGEVKKGNTLCAWPGCPMGRGWDETGVKGALVVDYGNGVTTEFVPLPTLQFHDEAVDREAWLRGYFSPVGTRDFYRITVTGRGESLTDAQKKADNVPHLEVRDRIAPPLDIWRSVGDDSFAGTYFGLLKQASQEADGELATLAAELSCRILEGEDISL